MTKKIHRLNLYERTINGNDVHFKVVVLKLIDICCANLKERHLKHALKVFCSSEHALYNVIKYEYMQAT